MACIKMLEYKIKDSGMTMTAVANKSGITRETLYNRLKGIGEFKASEIVGLSSTLRLSNAEREIIFFKEKVELNETTKGEDSYEEK